MINFPKRDYYGKPITALLLVQYLEHHGIQRRTYADDVKISARIQDLNDEFAGWFHPIKKRLFETAAAQKIIQDIENETNVLLLGAAGSGKSGCVGVLQKHLEDNHIPYPEQNCIHPKCVLSSVHLGHALFHKSHLLLAVAVWILRALSDGQALQGLSRLYLKTRRGFLPFLQWPVL